MSINIPIWLVPSILLALFFLCGLYYLVAKYYPGKFWITRFVRKNRIQLSLTFMSLLFLLLALGPVVLIPIPYGHSAVIWKRFSGGTEMDKTIGEGSALVMPWNIAYIYSTQYQTITHEFEAVTKNGLATKVYVIVRFRVLRNTLPYLHVNAGIHYINRMLLPEIGSWARLVIARHSAEEVYSLNRLEVQKEIFDLIKGGVDTMLDEQGSSCELKKGTDIPENKNCRVKDYFEIQDFLIQGIDLPKGIREAIVRKIEQTHLAEEYQWRITVAEKEAIRKEKEAEGIAKFQSIVTGGISDTYLRWRGIEATIELAKSNNAKVVIIGGGKDGLPIILNAESAVNNSLPALTTKESRSDSFLSVTPNELKQEEHVVINDSEHCTGGCDTNGAATLKTAPSETTNGDVTSHIAENSTDTKNIVRHKTR